MSTYDELKAKHPIRLWWEERKLAVTETWHRFVNWVMD